MDIVQNTLKPADNALAETLCCPAKIIMKVSVGAEVRKHLHTCFVKHLCLCVYIVSCF